MRRLALLILLLSIALAAPARAQLVVHTGTSNAGGGSASSQTRDLFSSVGEAAASVEMTGGGFTVTGGIVAVASTAIAPSVVHEAPGEAEINESVEITAAVDGSVRNPVLHYRPGGATTYTEVPMQRQDNTLVAVVPDSVVGSRGLSYFISVEDELGRSFRTPALGAFSLRVRMGGEGLVRGEAQPAGTDQSAYRLVSLPVEPDDASPDAVLEDDFGPYDPENWRFFGLDFDQQYDEFDDIDALQPGRGYWLITKEPDRVLDTGASRSTPTNQPYPILLHPRWNLIGVPFDFPVPLSQLEMASGQPFALRALDDGWNDPVRAPVTTLRPFEGYAIFNDLQRVDTLLIYPHPRGQGKTEPVLAAAKTAETAVEEWTLHVTAETANARDVDNAIGIRGAASEAFDALDMPEPPRYGDFVSVYFARPDWSAPSELFCTDFRNATDTGHVWDLTVQGERSEVVDLRFDGVDSVPPNFEAVLVDERISISVDLRDDPRYRLALPGADPVGLKLVVGTPSFVASHRPVPAELPTRVTVTDIFPNPFSSAASIRYVLPEPQRVRLRVFNAVGAEVARLADEERAAGAHLVVWDGRAASGTPAPSGVYFLQLVAGSDVHTARVVLVR
ncbi:MAG TPA: FlgD immunoglobulin-like domain containing protein [Rhodothermales bacterium]